MVLHMQSGGTKMEEFEIETPSFMEELETSTLSNTATRFKITVAASMAV